MYIAMTAFRLISLPTHAALEFTGGLALMVAPFVFGFTAAGLVVAVTLGAVLAGLGLTAASREGDRGPSVGDHFALDRALAFGLLLGAVGLAWGNDRAGATALMIGAAAQFALSLSTRYTARA
jgi:hypothetical protein